MLKKVSEYAAPVATTAFVARVFDMDPDGETFVAMEGGAVASVRKIKDPREAADRRIIECRRVGTLRHRAAGRPGDRWPQHHACRAWASRRGLQST